VDKELIDKLLADYKTPEDIVGENGLLKQLTKAIVERALHAELTTHLGYEKHSAEGNAEGNTRNGTSSKRLKGDFWDGRNRGAAGSAVELRTPAGAQGDDPVCRLR